MAGLCTSVAHAEVEEQRQASKGGQGFNMQRRASERSWKRGERDGQVANNLAV